MLSLTPIFITIGIVFLQFCAVSGIIISITINKPAKWFLFQFYSHIKKKLAHITKYMLPHRHDNSHLRRRHKLDQLPSCLSSSKYWIYTVFDQQRVKLFSPDWNVWQVGIALHYSSLSTLLWIGVSARVIYKEAVWKTPRVPEGESPAPPTQRPMLRLVRAPQLTFTHSPYH